MLGLNIYLKELVSKYPFLPFYSKERPTSKFKFAKIERYTFSLIPYLKTNSNGIQFIFLCRWSQHCEE